MDKILLSMIMIVFPILMYLVFSCYNSLSNKKIEKLVFIVTILGSLYMSFIFNLENNKMLLFCNIPILICYFKKDGLFGLILSILVILVGHIRFDVNIVISILKYFSYFVTFMLLYRRKEFNYLFLKISAVIQGFFISFEYFMNTYYGIDKVISLFFYILVIYLLTFFCLYLFKLADNVSSLYSIMNKIQSENKLKDSLFKLTHEIKNPIAVCKGYLDMMDLNNVDKSSKYINIIKNSIEAIENNGIINLDVSLEGKTVLISISDNGIGMDKEELDNIKEMFYTTKKNGTGLGVALSNEIVLAHNGVMEYESEINKGTKCIVKLPV